MAGANGEAAKQRPQIFAPSFTEKFKQSGKLVLRQGRGRNEPRIVAILSRQHGKVDLPLLRYSRERLDPVTPPIETAEQPHHDDFGVTPDLVDPEIDRHRMAQVAEMREPHAGEPVLLHRIGRGKTGKVAVGERQDNNVARRLIQIARLDDIVERRGCGLKEMHCLSEQ